MLVTGRIQEQLGGLHGDVLLGEEHVRDCFRRGQLAGSREPGVHDGVLLSVGSLLSRLRRLHVLRTVSHLETCL